MTGNGAVGLIGWSAIGTGRGDWWGGGLCVVLVVVATMAASSASTLTVRRLHVNKRIMNSEMPKYSVRRKSKGRDRRVRPIYDLLSAEIGR